MNLERDKAIEAMDVLTEHGYNAEVYAITNIPGTKTMYRVSVPALHFEDTDLRELCDLAESIGLHCRYSLNAIRLESTARRRANA